MHRYRIAVLRGGPSEEYDVSLRSGESVLGVIDREQYDPLDIIVSKSGEWLHCGKVRNPRDILESVDMAFLALHGAYGEDGTVQRMLDSAHVPYTGSGAFASAVALNKAMTKDRLRESGVRMARHMLVERSGLANLEGLVRSIDTLLGPKYVLKPVGGGSSIGTKIVANTELLFSTLASMLEQYEQILVEEFIAGKEATCGVVNNFRDQSLYTLPPIEIVPPVGASFFDYEVKYNGKTEEICPGRFSRTEKDEIERLAKLVHETLELSQYSRSDFIVTPRGVYFLEVNTLPGLTPESLMPKALDAVGCSYAQFVDHLIADTLKGR